MNRITITILFSIATAAIGFGAIGDDEKQVEARYGKPGKDLGNHGDVHEIGYMSGGFMILVDFVSGISRREGFVNPNTAPLTEEDIKTILNLSAPEGLTWDPGTTKQSGRSWNRSDQKAIAILPTEGTFLFVQDVNFNQPR